MFAALLLAAAAPYAQQLDDAARQSLQSQLEALEREAAALDREISKTQAEAQTLQQQVKLFNNEIKRRELEIKRLSVAIRQAEIDIQSKSASILELGRRIEKNRGILGRNILKLYEYDQENMLVVLAKNETLSEFFTTLDNIRSLQAEVAGLVDELRDTRKEFEKQKEELEDFRVSQLDLRALAEVERRAVTEKKAEKDRLLALTKGREAEFQRLLTQKQRDIAALRNQLFYIGQTGISAEDALKYAELAADRAGIRTAFLLALLEVETGRRFEGGVITAGTNLGSGTWRADMNPKQHTAFLEITAKLGFDPDRMPVSARPCAKATRERIGPGRPCGYGWGGAMGPAQFIPTTWLLFENRVASLTGHRPPNPWNVEDAFTASATFLADSGARSKTQAGESRAARTYLSGRPTCQTASCNSYANSILSLARSIERVI
ncbi:MAG: lytic murein transglycosylase [bacterium]|nr:lytic murein transglycosylase [bacterium]